MKNFFEKQTGKSEKRWFFGLLMTKELNMWFLWLSSLVCKVFSSFPASLWNPLKPVKAWFYGLLKRIENHWRFFEKMKLGVPAQLFPIFLSPLKIIISPPSPSKTLKFRAFAAFCGFFHFFLFSHSSCSITLAVVEKEYFITGIEYLSEFMKEILTE